MEVDHLEQDTEVANYDGDYPILWNKKAVTKKWQNYVIKRAELGKGKNEQ